MLADVPFDIISTFITPIRHLREHISCTQTHDAINPPATLPLNIHNLLCDATNQDHDTVEPLWKALMWITWAVTDTQNSDHLLLLFLKCGPTNSVAFHDFFPPHRTCIDPKCVQGERRTKNSRYHKLTEECHMRYYHNYCVQTDATLHSYYPGIPPYIHVAQRFFIGPISMQTAT
ncbi:hypothetical protein JB92DRAFT_2770151 [Gautieria morchelliformis]|nr:hypothetical protein JB92DRAFT_2770151 [Gautieria morchelliformis]